MGTRALEQRQDDRRSAFDGRRAILAKIGAAIGGAALLSQNADATTSGPYTSILDLSGRPLVNAHDLGVLPNNNDCYARLQAAINLASAKGNGLYFPTPPGSNYYFADTLANGNTPISIPSGMTILGGGWGGALTKYTGDICFDVAGGHIRIGGLSIDGGLSASAIRAAFRWKVDAVASGQFQYVDMFDLFTNANGSALITTSSGGKLANTISLRNWQDKAAVGLGKNGFDIDNVAGAIDFYKVHANQNAAETTTSWRYRINNPAGFFMTNCSAVGGFGTGATGGQGLVTIISGVAIWLVNDNFENAAGVGGFLDDCNFVRSFGLHVGANDGIAWHINKGEDQAYYDSDIKGNLASSATVSDGIFIDGAAGTQFITWDQVYLYEITGNAIEVGASVNTARLNGVVIRDRGFGGVGLDGLKLAGNDTWVEQPNINNCAANCINMTGGNGTVDNPALTQAGTGLYVISNVLPSKWIINANPPLPLDLGTRSGTFQLNVAASAQQKYVNGGAHTMRPGVSFGRCILYVTNNGSAGAIATPDWTKVTGSFDTTNGHVFCCDCIVGPGGSLLEIVNMF